MINKYRLDIFLYESGYAESREKARALILAGKVFVNGQKAEKAGFFITDKDSLEVKAADEFVSRGGYKLKKALSVFNISLEGKICADIGASTGGFADCMLQNGASKVYCVDVGYGQLAWKLRNDPRVVNFERTNARYLKDGQISEKCNFISVDVSFISLELILPIVYNTLSADGEAVCLIKPQFEAGRDKVGKKGVVKDAAAHAEVIGKIYDFSGNAGFYISGLDYSPIKGPEGNIEYLIYITKKSINNKQINIDDIVKSSHNNLNKKDL
ncbi:MAG: TlyA family RNA methyltransferase [Oscillospiraceae bacterium]|nr:TlyA family RNA methyltransferase [Oscillospiraceae bacterium]